MKTITQAHPPMPLQTLVEGIKSFDERPLEEKIQFLSALVAVHVTLNVRWGPGSRYYRARSMSFSPGALNVEEVIWRKDAPARSGRANPDGFPVLYLANRSETCYREIGIDIGDVALAEFTVRQDKSCHVAPIGEFASIYASGRGRLIGDQAKLLYSFLNACDIQDIRSLVITDSFLQRVMAIDEAPYSLSSHIARSIFEKVPAVRCIAFESTKLSGSINFAVRIEDFWETWGLTSVSALQVVHLAEGVYSTPARRDVAQVDQDGAFRWAPQHHDPNICRRFTEWVPPRFR